MVDIKKIVYGVGFSISLLLSQWAYSSGFQISEVSVSGLGRSFAGAGVAGDSVSEMFFNPGSLGLRSGTELEIGIHAISTTAYFKNKGSSQTTDAMTSPSSGTNDDGGGGALVPNIFMGFDVNEKWRAGLGITAPFGLKTDYDPGWVGRYSAIKSELTTVDIAPTIAYKIGNHTIGAAINIVKAEAELSRALFTGVGSPDGQVKVNGDDTAIGYSVGVVGENNIGRIGVGFRSAVTVELDGDLNISPLGITSGAKAKATLPKSVYISALLKKSDKLDVMGSIRWTDWSSFKTLRIQFDNGFPDAVTPENWRPVTTVSLGFNYRASDTWTYRGGIAFDKAATHDEFRTARIPDADRYWLSFGGSYAPSENTWVDFGYAHIFADNAPLNESTNHLVDKMPGATTDNLVGEYTDTDANILSVAVSFKFGN